MITGAAKNLAWGHKVYATLLYESYKTCHLNTGFP